MIKTIIISDLKIIFRDASLRIIFFLPFLLLILLRFLPDYLEAWIPGISDYNGLILAAFCMLSSGLVGFILAFILLDEKEQNLVIVFRILPFHWEKLLYIRTWIIILHGFLTNIVLIIFSGLGHYNPIYTLILSFSASLVGPSLTFIITSLAGNKVEGVTLFKLLNLLLFLPIAGLFIESRLALLFGLFPNYWIYCSFYSTGPFSQHLNVFVALISNILLITLARSLLSKNI